jgi:integral membrane sensor domain MASE1
MVPFKFLLLSAVVAAVLAAIGVTSVMAMLNPSATEIAQSTSNNDPLTPPEFYGRR